MTRLRNGSRKKGLPSALHTSPGWRRNVERKAERAQSENARKRQQKALRERADLTNNEGGESHAMSIDAGFYSSRARRAPLDA